MKPPGDPAAVATGVSGLALHRGALDGAAQEELCAALRLVAGAAPMRRQVTPGGRVMSVRMTSAGGCGWISDRAGYRYDARQPDGRPWPPIPPRVLALWHQVTGLARPPDCCLVNYYGEDARMGLHQDRDEGDFTAPVVSISLGDAALFRIGGVDRGGPTRSFWLQSGDVLVMGGQARLAWHGVDRLRFGSSRLLPHGGRINLTLRVVDPSVVKGVPDP
jgi:alkylated DNA repair protein (DNA oxidative demethylase)